MRRARPSSTPVQGDHPRWIRARTGATAKRCTSWRRAGPCTGSRTSAPSTMPAIRDHRVGDRGLLAGADVDHQPAPPARRPHQRIDDIVDEDEVAGLAPIAVHHRRPAGGCSIDERRDHTTGRALTRSVDTAQCQRRELDRMEVAIRHEQVDDRRGDDAAHTTWFELRRLTVLDRERLRRRVPVDRRRRERNDDLRHAVASRRFEGCERREECIALSCGVRGVARQQGELEDHVRVAGSRSRTPPRSRQRRGDGCAGHRPTLGLRPDSRASRH